MREGMVVHEGKRKAEVNGEEGPSEGSIEGEQRNKGKRRTGDEGEGSEKNEGKFKRKKKEKRLLAPGPANGSCHRNVLPTTQFSSSSVVLRSRFTLLTLM